MIVWNQKKKDGTGGEKNKCLHVCKVAEGEIVHLVMAFSPLLFAVSSANSLLAQKTCLNLIF